MITILLNALISDIGILQGKFLGSTPGTCTYAPEGVYHRH